MKKTSVYLTEEAVAALKRASAQSGRAQAEIVRDAIQEYVVKRTPRRFLSAGVGHSGRRRSIAETEERELRKDIRRDRGWR
jgi:metal-responsive CopG/Arc/MetJ family transcriptional regulator